MWNNSRLRTLVKNDLDKVLAWRNSENIRINMYNDHIISMDEHRTWFRNQRNNPNNVYKIFEWNMKPVGMVYFTDIDTVNGKCRWGFYLGENNLPPGLGLTMGFMGIEYAFERIGVRKLWGEALAYNLSSINFHEKLGFTKEGLFAEHVLKQGNYEDVIFFALLKRDWQAAKEKIKELIMSY